MALYDQNWRGLHHGRSNRGIPWGRRGNARPGGARGRGHHSTQPRICTHYQSGRCRFVDQCRYSHDLSGIGEQGPLGLATGLSEQDHEHERQRETYNEWKRLIKTPPRPNDVGTVGAIWMGALSILDSGDRDYTQMLPRDLDDDRYFGRHHIQIVLSMTTPMVGSRELVRLAQPFLRVLAHTALLDCLSVDTFVGNLYNYVSGSHGTRAIAFFHRLSTHLVNVHTECAHLDPDTDPQDTLNLMATALCELLRREPRAIFNEDLPDLIESLANHPVMTGCEEGRTRFQHLVNRIVEIRAIVARAKGLLVDGKESDVKAASTAALHSSYPRENAVPGSRHDNDKMDMTKIRVFPTDDEIRSDQTDFLPSTNRDEIHFLVDPVERHLDTHFRLLRHDIFGQLKRALAELMMATESDPTILTSHKLGLGDLRAYAYPEAHVGFISYDQRRGFEAQISFPQPPHLRKRSTAERRTWWEESKRLDEGVLLCFVSMDGDQSSILFFTVSKKCVQGTEFSLTADNHHSTIAARLTDCNQIDMELMIRQSCRKQRGALLEFPGVLPATFVPILENLQNMQRQSRLPFRQWILPDRVDARDASSPVLDIPAPLYAREPGFKFSLKAILKDPDDDLSLNPDTPIDDLVTVDQLETRTCLDRGQCAALLAALLREYALIQGPPGTGKSYLGVHLMRILLSGKAPARLGPIVVVCFTNHALDQFLEHLCTVGIHKIIRIGGRSQSTVLEGKNLSIVSQGEGKTSSERYLLAKTYESLEAAETSIAKQLKLLHGAMKRPSWAIVRRHLVIAHPRVCAQFERYDEDGYQTAGRHPFQVWMRGERSPLTSGHPEDPRGDVSQSLPELLRRATEDVHCLSPGERQRLLESWMQEIHESATDDICELVKSADRRRRLLSNIHDDVDRRVLETADVIGVTTTGLAKKIATLRHVKCKVVICEEAGEVMEPHLLSALLPSVEHFIQIGDHEQLRAKVNDHGLSLESPQGAPYQLDRSQFERLAVGERERPRLPVAQLRVQRRMRPEISALIRETIYPRLIDHDTTKDLPDVVGMSQNVFWLDHDNAEDGWSEDSHQKSHSNHWEVEFTHALVRHLVRQGKYSSSDIAVLTPYTGQLKNLRARMRSEFEIVLSERDEEILATEGFAGGKTVDEFRRAPGPPESENRPLEKKKLSDLLRIATVDNFQGEESKIIIVSLVRSNKKQKVGFLKTTNRINVLLSRAQHGIYLIGNADTYAHVPMWAQVLGLLGLRDAVGKTLRLCCPRHPETDIQVRRPEDFARLSPEGGCRLTCSWRLPRCGHRCQATCHSDRMHQIFPCRQPCQRLHSPCNHSCQKATCGEECGLCLVRLDDVLLPCSHFQDAVPCYLAQNSGQIKCDTVVGKRVPGCGHVVQIPCGQDATAETFRCPEPCPAILPCGHQCPGSCGGCRRKELDGGYAAEHAKCRKICGRRFATCNHTCRKFCHDEGDCGLCLSPCEVRCGHSRCTLKCYEPCAPCIERCTWSCEHIEACVMPCAAPCARLPCNERCSQKLGCGHRCPGICGETCCEGHCHVCADVGETRVDLLEMKTYAEIDPDESPIVVLGCGHFFTADTLDGVMGMGDVYVVDASGAFRGLKDISTELAGSVPRCPDCQCPVRQHVTQRYNRMINRAVIDEMSKRFLVSGQEELRLFERQTEEWERDLDTSSAEVMSSIQQLRSGFVASSFRALKLSSIEKELRVRQEKVRVLQKQIQSITTKFGGRHEPTLKLQNATIYAARQRSGNSLSENSWSLEFLSVSSSDRRVMFRARKAQIRLDYHVLKDKFSIAHALKSADATRTMKIPGGAPAQLAKPFFQLCSTFIDECWAENLPKLGVEASLYQAGIVRPFESYCRSNKAEIDQASAFIATARSALEQAKTMCARRFENADVLCEAVEESMKMLRKQWYEEVSAEEIAAIKAAMVAGPQGIATHSGHWYNCANGHPFAIGECGMPMEQARCPECGAPIGGQNHQAVEGVTRARDMED